jgi:hypothetical protein
MSLESQLQRHYEWTPNYRLVFKKPVPTGSKTFKVPQTTGNLGWIVFTYEKSIPVCLWMNSHECKKIQCIADERICGDTFLRVEKINNNEFVISDIWMYNSNCVYACSTFSQRYEWLKQWIPLVLPSQKGMPKFIHKSESNHPIRGYEEHPEEVGKPGYYVEKDDSEMLTVNRTNIPDCYEIVGKGYLRVPDIKTSFYLRSKGETFQCKCIPYDDEFWDVVENIPDIDVNAS